MINIAMVDDHQLLMDSLKTLLCDEDDIREIRTFTDGKQFLEECRNGYMPNIIICDLLMKGMSGMELLPEIRKQLGDNCKIIILSGITNTLTIKEAFSKGANGYLSKNVTPEDLIDAIRKVSKGDPYLYKDLKDKLFRHMVGDDEIAFQLTPRETEILQKICSGETPKKISGEMGISIFTVQQHINNIKAKFNVGRTTELVVFAIQVGLYNPIEGDPKS